MRWTSAWPSCARSCVAFAGGREQKSGVQNLLSGDAATRLDAFQAWAVQAAEQLEFVLPIDNVDRLVRTPRHDLLMGRATAHNESLVNRTISAEQAGQLKAFEVLIGEYEAANVACEAWEPTVLVPDTNVYLHQEAYFDEIGWRQMAAVSGGVLVLVPAAVLRELDSGKRANGQKTVSDTNRQLVRTRARVTSRRIRERFTSPGDVVPLTDGVRLGLLLDSVGHERLPHEDNEIIERVSAVQALSGRHVAIVTGDGNM